MLQRFTRTGHVHGVGQVGPANAVVLHFGRQTFIGLETNGTRDVVLLSGTAGGMNEHHSVVTDVLCMQGTGEQFVVRAVNGVTALERHHVLTFGQACTHLSRGLAGEHPLGQSKTLEASTQIEALALHRDHPNRRVLNGGGAVAALGFSHFVGFPLVLHLEDGQVLTLVGEQQLVAHHHVIAVGVHHDRQAEQLASSQTMPTDHGVVVLLVHEATQGREATNTQQLHITGVAIGTLDRFGRHGFHSGKIRLGHHQINQRSAVGSNHTGSLDRS